MSYTRSWSNNIPSGGSQASSIDDSIRALRVDLYERLTELIDAWIDGPVKLKTTAFGSLTRQLILGPHSGNAADGEATTDWTDDYFQSATGGPAFRVPVILPIGAQITRIQYFVDKNNGTTVDAKLKKTTLSVSPTVVEVHPPLQTSDTGIKLLDTGTVAITIQDDNYYFIQINGDSQFRFYGAKITYTAPAVV